MSFRFDERITTVSLLYTDVSNPILYFTYERTRYLAHTASCSFEPFHVNFDLETKALHNQAIGLTSRDSEFRLEMCGRNFIQVEVPSFLKALSQECVELNLLFVRRVLLTSSQASVHILSLSADDVVWYDHSPLYTATTRTF